VRHTLRDAIASRPNGAASLLDRRAHPRLYVRETPTGGSDWGYVDRRADAAPLSPYWQRRFRADMIRVGSVAFLEPLEAGAEEA
jgi:hypothetical protein